MELPPILALDGVSRDYAWGSATAIPALLGQEPNGRPLAELWFGAHPSAPSPVPALGMTLDEVIAADPVAALGWPSADRFDGQLPFLVKLLAVDRPLSIQVHPDAARARAGFAAEDARAVPIDAPERHYRDRNHKPELLCALTEFEALCGFRPVSRSRAILEALPADAREALRDVRADLGAGPPRDGLRAGFTRLSNLTGTARRDVVEAVVTGCRELVDGPMPGGAGGAAGTAGADVRVAAGVAVRCAEMFPGDIGAVLTLLLNHVRLRPGEAVYLAPGTVHCYLSGLGVEVMANSDNALRCGLTPKHVDVGELLAAADFGELVEPRCADLDGAHGAQFAVPVPDFTLLGVDLDAFRKPGRPAGSCAVAATGSPHLVLCVSGTVRVEVAGASVELVPGGAAFVPARAGAPTLAGSGRTFVVGVGV